MKNIAQAIINVMTEVKNIEKKTNVGTGSASYKAIGDSMVRNELKESMVKNGLVIVPISIQATTKVDRWEEETQYGKKSKQYLLLHTSGESIELSGYGQGVDTQDKGAGKATTYALKNVLLDTFLIIKGDEMDTDATHSNDIEVPKVYTKKQSQYDTDPLIDKIDEEI